MKSFYTVAFTGIGLLVVVCILQCIQYYNSLFYVRGRLETKEPFENEKETTGITEASGSMGPADADLETGKKPYHLLRGVLPDADKDTTSGMTAEGCYAADFQKRYQPVASYLQRTNNYKRAAPDSCTAPMTELVSSFYKVDPLA